MEYTKKCKRCGKQFTTCQSKAIFCSRSCKEHYRHESEQLETSRLLNMELHSAQESMELMKKKSAPTMSLSEAAKYLGVSRPTIYGYIKNGHLPAIDLPGRTIIKREDLDSLFSKSTSKGTIEVDLSKFTTFYKIMDEYHVSYNFAREVMHEFGLKPIVRQAVQYYQKEDVVKAFIEHERLINDSKYQRKMEYARRKQMRRSKEYIPEDYPHDPCWYSFYEVMNKYHLDRNQVEQYAREKGVRKSHINRFALFDKEGFDAIFSTTPPFDL